MKFCSEAFLYCQLYMDAVKNLSNVIFYNQEQSLYGKKTTTKQQHCSNNYNYLSFQNRYCTTILGQNMVQYDLSYFATIA